MSNITIQDKQFNSGLFDNIKSINIPPYQREYCWDKKDCEELFYDILTIYNKKNSAEKHYIGSLVVIDHASKGIYEIIDGQQRFTTISILFFAIKNLLQEYAKDNENLNGRIEDIIKKIDGFLYDQSNGSQKSQKLKLKHLNHDADIYEDLLSGKPNNQKFNNKNIKINYYHFLDLIKKNSISTEDQNLKIDFLKSIFEIIQMRLIFAFVKISNTNLSNSQKIFESLNNTGKKLTASDLIRNFVLMPEISKLADDEESQKKFFGDWNCEIEEKVLKNSKTKNELDDFYRHYLIVRTGSVISNSSIYSNFKKVIKENLFRDATIFKDVKKIADLYYQIKIKNDDKKIDFLLSNFRLLKLWSLMPLLIYFFENKNEMNSDDFYSSLKILINFGFRMSCVDDTKRIVSATLINSLKNQVKNEGWGNISKIIPSILKMPNDEDVEKALLQNDHKKDLHKFILMAIEENLSKDKMQKDYEKLEREHILASKHEDNKQYQEYIGKLGNFTLATSDLNKKISNDDICDKIENYYKDSSHELNKEIKGFYGGCNKDIAKFIDERGKALCKRILEIFPYHEPNYSLRNDITNDRPEDEPDFILDKDELELKDKRGEIVYKKPQVLIIYDDRKKEIDRIGDFDDNNLSWKDVFKKFAEILKKNFKDKPRSTYQTLLDMSKMCEENGIDGKNVYIYVKNDYE